MLGRERTKVATQMDQFFALRWTLIGGGIYLLICGRFTVCVTAHNGRSDLRDFLLGVFLRPMGYCVRMPPTVPPLH